MNMKKLLLLSSILCLELAPAAMAQTTNVIQVPVRLAFDYTNSITEGNVDGFLLMQTTNIALPLDQWTPVLGVAASVYPIPGTNFQLPIITNQVAIVKTNGQAVLATQWFYSLAATNSTFGTNAMSFSNVATNRGLPVGGSNLRAQ
jgi:hypothetical protein